MSDTLGNIPPGPILTGGRKKNGGRKKKGGRKTRVRKYKKRQTRKCRR